MPLPFLEQRKRIIYLLAILLALLVITWFVGQRFMVTKYLSPQEEMFRPPRAEINFDFLDSPQLRELQPLDQVPPLEQEPGRENPFLPHQGKEPSTSQ